MAAAVSSSGHSSRWGNGLPAFCCVLPLEKAEQAQKELIEEAAQPEVEEVTKSRATTNAAVQQVRSYFSLLSESAALYLLLDA